MNQEKVDYILRYHRKFVSEEDRLILDKFQRVFGYKSLIRKVDATKYSPEEIEKLMINKFGISNEDIIYCTELRFTDFRKKLAINIDKKNNLQFNTCPICGTLARTPEAKQAKCGHNWR